LSILYATITLRKGQSSNFIRLIDSRPEIASYVRTICLTTPHDHVVRVLSECTRIVNIACWVFLLTRLFYLVETYQPRRLSTSLTYLIGLYPPFDHPFFSNITHLELTDSWGIWVNWVALQELPRLTHIALDFQGDMESSVLLVGTLQAILTCKTLKICLLFVDDDVPEKFPHTGPLPLLSRNK
jgi:hypothetical protein